MLVLLIIFAVLARIGDSASKNIEPAFLKASNEFSMDVYSRIVEGYTGSVIFSPASIQQVLTMLSLGAVGSTKDQLMAGLKYPADYTSDDVERNCEILTANVKKSPFLKMANKIFVKIGAQVQPAFEAITKKVFGSETQALDFTNPVQATKIINDWIAAQTNNKIINALSPDVLTRNISMVLVNAIYFLGNWEYQFDPKKTRKETFYNAVTSKEKNVNIKVDMMVLYQNLNYTDLSEFDATAVRLPYKNSDISMMIILPNSVTGLPLLEKRLKVTAFEDIAKNMKIHPVTLYLPKFQMETEVELGNSLKAMGMDQMFTSRANFSALLAGGGNYKVSQVLHKAVIEVNEVGTEAAATTIAVMPTSSNSKDRFFVADHPFFFAIYNNDGIYFSGRVNGF